ncbi:MAG: TrbC/VirB2 family protein [Candidatus Magasanikbacteria bacterium]|nr:TrbC/VirB2 family protein [Candidatus Magasanikbacteria bacterium]
MTQQCEERNVKSEASGRWRVVFGIVFVLGLLFAAVPSTRAATCAYTCVGAGIGQGSVGEVLPDATCGATCQAHCISHCGDPSAARGGCYSWDCNPGGASLAGGDACPLSAYAGAFGASAELTRVSGGLAAIIGQTGETGDRWRCLTQPTSAVPNDCLDVQPSICQSGKCCSPSGLVAAPVANCNVQCTNGLATNSLTPSAAVCPSTCLGLCNSFCGSNGGCFAYSCAGTPQGPGGQCAVVAIGAGTAAQQRTAKSTLAGQTTTDATLASLWQCKTVTGSPSGCVSLGCPGTTSNVKCCSPSVAGTLAGAGPQPCAEVALANGLAETDLAGKERSTNTVRANWQCSRVCAAETRTSRCVTGGCPGTNSDTLCCAPNTPTSANACQSGTTSGAPRHPSTGARLILPDCIGTGNCTLNDIVNTGVSFIDNLLIPLAAAIFLAIMVWAGFMYVAFAYDSGKVGEAKKMIAGATIGIVIMLGASTIIKFVQQMIIGSTGSGAACSRDMGVGYSCMPVDNSAEAIRVHRCVAGKCPGALFCCQIATGANASGGAEAPAAGATPAGGTTPSAGTPTPTVASPGICTFGFSFLGTSLANNADRAQLTADCASKQGVATDGGATCSGASCTEAFCTAYNNQSGKTCSYSPR